MNARHFFLLFSLIQFSIIVGYGQSEQEIESVFKSFSVIENDFHRLDSLKAYVHPKNGNDMRQSIKLLELERFDLGPISEKPLQHLLLNNLIFKCYRSLNEYQSGVSYLVRGKEIANQYSQNNDEWENALAELYLETAFVNYAQQKPVEAFTDATKAMNAYKKLNNEKKLAETYWRIGIAKSQRGESKDALYYYDEAEKLIDPFDEADNYLRVQYLKSIELSIQNRFVAARRILVNILPKMKAANHTNYAVALAKMGQVETQLGNLLPAGRYLKEAEALKINTTDLNAKGVIAHRFEEYYLATGQFQNAYDQLAIRKSIADSVSRKRMKDETIVFQNRLNELNEQQEIKDKRYQQVIQESSFKSWLGILSGLFLSILSFLGLLWYRREKNRMQTLLDTPKETEIVAEPEISVLNITNDLRTSLAMIIGQLSQLKNEPLSSHGNLLLNSALKESENFVSNFDDFNKMEGKLLAPNLEDGDLILFLDELVDRSRINTKEKEFVWNKTFEGEQFLCKLDFEKLNAILTGLVNYVGHNSPAYSKVKMLFNKKRDYAVIKLGVNGHTIDEQQLKHMFDWNFQSEKVNAELSNNSSLGLALSKELTKLMKGTLTLNLISKDEYEFELQVPFQKVDKSTLAKIEQVKSAIAASPTSDVATPPDVERPKLLLVGHQLNLSKYTEKTLSNSYDVTSFSTATSAETWALENIPDIILTDSELPDMTGFELAKVIKNNSVTNNIPVAVLAFRNDSKMKKLGSDANVDALLTKPVKAKSLIKGLNKLRVK